jgi:hypothetical protein
VNPVLIEWVDSTQPVSSWKYLSDAPDLEIVECASVGWVIQENESVLMLAPNLGDYKSGDGAQGSGFIRIPKASITRQTQLEEVNRPSSFLSSHPGQAQKPRVS